MSVYNPDTSFNKLFPSQLIKQDVTYVPSRYAIDFEYCGRQYIFSTLTRQCVEAKLPSKAKTGEGYDSLISERFLVPKGTDEFAFYKSVLSLLRMTKRKKCSQAYTILPTLGCNARCIYCFQSGMKQVSMTSEIVDDTLIFILNDSVGKKVTLSWFGGEPLLRQDVIDKISTGVRDSGREYSGLMITNGSLITPETVVKMKDLWHLERIQISTDGDEKEYISRKQYIKYSDYYHTVIDSINRISEAGIEVMVRCNVDYDNLSGVPFFIEELANKVTNKENVTVYLTPLYQVLESDNDLEIWTKLIKMQKVIESNGFKVTFERFNTALPKYRCMADAGGIVVAPDGSLHCCENLPDGSLIGNVKEGIINQDAREKFTDLELLKEKCKQCAFLPDCRPNPGCPKYETHCQEAMKIFLLDALKRRIDENKVEG